MGVQMKTQDLQINQFMLKNLSMGFCDRILCVWCAPILVGSILIAFIIFSFNPALSQEKKGDPSFVAVGAGSFDFNRKKDDGLELRIEYRSGQKFGDTIFKPFGAIGYSPNDHTFLEVGYWSICFSVGVMFLPQVLVLTFIPVVIISLIWGISCNLGLN